MLTLSFLFWLLCFYLNRNGNIIPSIGGGCFGSDAPERQKIKAQEVPKVSDLYPEAISNGSKIAILLI